LKKFKELANEREKELDLMLEKYGPVPKITRILSKNEKKI